jgi:hypothetical protein
MIKTTLYASKVLGNQRWNVDRGGIDSKIFHSNQSLKQASFMSSTPKRRDEVRGFIFSFLVVDEDFSCCRRWYHLSFLHPRLLIVLLKRHGNWQPNRICRPRIGIKVIKVLNKKIDHPSISQSNKLSQLQHKPITNFRTPYYPRFEVGLGEVDLGETIYN